MYLAVRSWPLPWRLPQPEQGSKMIDLQSAVTYNQTQIQRRKSVPPYPDSILPPQVGG
jgi:hypothetical protein